MLTVQMIGMTETWMRAVKLKVDGCMTYAVMVSNCQVVQHFVISVGRSVIPSKRTPKNLGLMVDNRLNFNSLVDYTIKGSEDSRRVTQGHV